MFLRSPCIFIALLILFSACGKEKAEDRWTRIPKQLPEYETGSVKSYKALFYNCENLFDTLDAEGVDDDGFTPEGQYEWNSERYGTKMQRIAQAIGEFASTPDLVGLCEIENMRVLEDLCSEAPLKRANYGILHYESRDPRGIDLALLYDPERFHPYDRQAYSIKNPGSGTSTRPILSIGLETESGDSLRTFLCHWPSRAGGKAESEADRMNASSILQDRLAALHDQHPKRSILIMGDLNDHPRDKSIRSLIEGDHGFALKDLFAKAHQKGKGSYNYRGEWGVLDHFILNRELMKASNGLLYKKESAKILREEELLYFDKEYEQYRPDRYMKRGAYYGGYSDHLPISLELHQSQ